MLMKMKIKSTLMRQLNQFRRRVKQEGLLLAVRFYIQRTVIFIFCKMVFGRSDIVVPVGAKLVGLRYIKIGRNFIAGRGLWLEAVSDFPVAGQKFTPELIIGNRVNIGEYVHIGCNHRVIIGDDVLMGSKIYITDHNHGVYRGDNQDSPMVPPAYRRLNECEYVRIGDRCWIGEFVTILPGVTIGEGCIIGSHSTVTHDIPANSIAIGSPAKVIKVWDEILGRWATI